MLSIAWLMVVLLSTRLPVQASGTQAAPRYATVDLGALPAKMSALHLAVNSAGQVLISYKDYGPPPTRHAELVTDGKRVDLNELIRLGPGARVVEARGLNDSGHIVGLMQRGSDIEHGFVYDGTKIYDLGEIAPNCMNNSDQAAGTYTGRGPSGVFLWSGRFITRLGDFGMTALAPAAISNTGNVVGVCITRSNPKQAFVLTLHTFNLLPSLGGVRGAATAVNDMGAVAGWATTAGERSSHIVLYIHGKARDLEISGTPAGINNAMEVVGDATFGTERRAFLWRHEKTYDLNSLTLLPAGWTLERAYGISTRGHIVATGKRGEEQHVFLLSPRK